MIVNLGNGQENFAANSNVKLVAANSAKLLKWNCLSRKIDFVSSRFSGATEITIRDCDSLNNTVTRFAGEASVGFVSSACFTSPTGRRLQIDVRSEQPFGIETTFGERDGKSAF